MCIVFSSSFNFFHHRLNHCIIQISFGTFSSCVAKDNMIHKFISQNKLITVLFLCKMFKLTFFTVLC